MSPNNGSASSKPSTATAAVAPSLGPIKNAFNQHTEHSPLEHPELHSVFPTTKFDPLPEFHYEDRALFADDSLKNLLEHAEVEHLAPKIGTALSGLQLHELTAAQKDELALLVAQRGVVFFRDQEITLDQQIALGKYWGPLHVHQNLGHPEGYPEIVVVENSLESSAALLERQKLEPTNEWHSDVSCERQPPSYTIFKLLTNPPVGGDTLWASGYEAYDRLTDPMKKFLEGLTAVHSSKKQAEDAAARGFTIRRPPVEFTHPVIRTHPVTKRRALYVNAAFTIRIKELSVYESDAVLRFLYRHVNQGHEFQVRYRWSQNAVAIWDNRVTFHYATFDYLPGNRHAVRVTPHGEIPNLDKEE